MKEFQRLPGPLSSRPDPRTNLFHLLFLLADGGDALPPPLGSLLLSSRSPQGHVAAPSFSIALLRLLYNSTDPSTLLPQLAPSTKPSPSLPPFLSPPLPPWASELDCLPFGFPLFLPSSVPPLIAPLFLTSQGCQLSSHSWKIHSQHSNCKQTEREREQERDFHALNLLVTDRNRNRGTPNSVFFLDSFSTVSHISIIFITYPVAPL